RAGDANLANVMAAITNLFICQILMLPAAQVVDNSLSRRLLSELIEPLIRSTCRGCLAEVDAASTYKYDLDATSRLGGGRGNTHAPPATQAGRRLRMNAFERAGHIRLRKTSSRSPYCASSAGISRANIPWRGSACV